jgi:pimeloyl-ACP methyl ester carboxylesterase
MKDKVEIRYYVSVPPVEDAQTDGTTERTREVMLLPCPNGQCPCPRAAPRGPRHTRAGGPSVYYPIMAHFGANRYTYITWDYRGMFSSSRPKRQSRMTIRDHAEDAKQILDLLGYPYARRRRRRFALMATRRAGSSEQM